MKIDWQKKRAYESHSVYRTRMDNKKRQYFFEIENLDGDYEELKRILENHLKISFDFVASCIKKIVLAWDFFQTISQEDFR